MRGGGEEKMGKGKKGGETGRGMSKKEEEDEKEEKGGMMAWNGRERKGQNE